MQTSTQWMRNGSLVLCALWLSGCVTPVPPEEDPVLIKLTQIERRLERVERVVQNDSLVQLVTRVDALAADIDQLRGSAETSGYEIEQMAERQRALYADLDERIQAIETRTRENVMQGGSLPPGELPLPNGSDRENYQAAFELLKEGRYDQSARAFEQFLVAYPQSELADNAQYWLAESFYVSQRFDDALPIFNGVIDNYPQSRKVPDALLKVGYCHHELKRWDEAESALTRVVADYPETTAARLASKRLERVRSERG
ncbi:MAG: tol-pal system protein YbgF [Pseudomonadota bacterium]